MQEFEGQEFDEHAIEGTEFDEDHHKEDDLEEDDEAPIEEESEQDEPLTANLFITNGLVCYPQIVMTLTINDAKLITVIQDAISTGDPIIVTGQNADENTSVKEIKEEERFENLCSIATEVQVVKSVRINTLNYNITLKGLRRVRILDNLEEIRTNDACIPVAYEPIELDANDPHNSEFLAENEAIWRAIRIAIKQVAKTSSEAKDIAQLIANSNNPAHSCDLIAAHLDFNRFDKLTVLCSQTLKERLTNVLKILTKRIEIVLLSSKIQAQISQEVTKSQKEYFLRQQLKAIKSQLGENEDETFDLQDLKERLKNTQLPDDVRKICDKQISRLSLMPTSSSEYSVARDYLETLLDIPWLTSTEDDLSVTRARRILDEDHYDLEKVKKRIIEFLAVHSLKKDLKGPILCLYGPPGVGKTSLGKSVARALGRKFHRFSLGGMHDESEIRGHRRTYVGSLPGRIVQALRKVGTNNPVIMLDEIDKVGKDYHGDPASALLEVLDPEQNYQFNDHYVEHPVDLSHVLFIATANNLDTISPPLRDRMEVIEIPGYTLYDKIEIARHFLIPRILEENGITEKNLIIDDESLNILINNHTREAGVRSLEHRIADLARAAAVGVAESRDTKTPEPTLCIDKNNIEEYLGKNRFDYDVAMRTKIPGVATGLAWTPAGGDILFIEVTAMPGKNECVITGKLGDVMKESIRAAFSYIRSHAEELGLKKDFNKDTDIHVHVPAGAVPKDGPSAGITIFSAILSYFLKKCVRNDLAMTGEITLLGHVLPVGGIKEKLLAAHRAGIKNILMPEKNKRDLIDVKKEILNDLNIQFITSVDELLPQIFAD